MIRTALFVGIGALLLAANVWFVRTVYRTFFQKAPVAVHIEVIGTKEEVAGLDKGLAHLVAARYQRIGEDFQNIERTHERLGGSARQTSSGTDVLISDRENLADDAYIVPGFQIVDFGPLILLGQIEPFEQNGTPIKVSIGSVEVEGLIRWLQRQFSGPQTVVSFSIDVSGENVWIAGNLHDISGEGKDVVWTSSPRASNEIADTIAHALIQKRLASPETPVHELEIAEFQALLSLLLNIEQLNAELIRQQEPIDDELKSLLPEAMSLRDKLPHWQGFTYFVASLAEGAGDSETALTLYKQLASYRELDGSQLEPIFLDRVDAKIAALSPVLPIELPPVEELSVSYDRPLLESDRQVSAVLEIDWITGTPRPELVVETTDGIQTIESILSEIGIDLTVIWNDELPLSVMGVDGGFDKAGLISTMESYRQNFPPDSWHFYLIYGGRHVQPSIKSIMFDVDRRRGAAVFTRLPLEHPNETVFLILHEMGHMLNLPHPWQAYGDTKSVMTFPFRWRDNGWSWDDPGIYRFDSFGQQHIRRGPEIYVKPGESSFLDFGESESDPWAELEK